MLKNDKFNIFALASRKNFKRFIYFKVTLRDKIKYDIELIDCFENCFDAKKINHVIYACETITRNKQAVPPNYNNNFVAYLPQERTYTYETSSIDILIECSDREYKITCEDLGKNIGKKSKEVLYKTLEYFAYKYNLAVSGNDFIETANLCVGNFECYAFFRDKKTGEYKNEKMLITPVTSIIKCNNNYNNLVFQNILNKDIPVWVYFFNKTKYFYIIYNNLECVMNASISIEAYIIYLIKNANRYNDYQKKNKNNLGYRNALQYAKDNRLIDAETASVFKEGYEKICLQRSLIVHGAIDSPLIGREMAKIAYETIIDIFVPIEKNFNELNELEIQEVYFEEDYNRMNRIIRDVEKGKYEEAIEKLNYNITNNIFKDFSLFTRARCLAKLGKTDKAIVDYNECISNRYRLIESYNSLGIELGKIKKHEEAKNIYIEAIKLDAGYAEFYYNLGIEYQNLKQYDEAILNYKKALEIKKIACYYYNLGTAYYYKNDFINTLNNYNHAIKIDGENSKYLYERAFLYEILKKPDDAENDIIKCLKNLGDEPHISLVKARLYNIGCLYQELERWNDAIRVFSKGCDIDPSRMCFFQARGNCYRDLGNFKKSRLDYEKCFELEPNNYDNFTNMIYLLIEEKNFKEAKKYIDEFMVICKENKKIINCLEIYYINCYQYGVISHMEFLEFFYQNYNLNNLEESELYNIILNKLGKEKTNKFFMKT